MGFLRGDAIFDLKLLDFSLRLFVIPFNVASIWIAVKNREDNPDYGKLEFRELVGLKYMVCVFAYLMVTSMAALVEFLYLAYNGDQVVSWSKACVSYGHFCSRLKVALILHIIAVLCFLVLAVISAFRVFRRFDPPFVPSKEGQQDRI